MRKLLAAALCLAATVTATGCGATVEPSDDAGARSAGKAVTLTNCGREITFDKVPERVVTNDVGITELMFALGLEDRMAGFAMPDDKGDLSGVPWKDGYDEVKWLSKDQLTKENVLDARADLVFAGWNYGFREDAGFTPDALEKLGVPSYILTESCRNGRTGTSRGIMPPLDALYTDLTNLGKLFGVEQRAATLIADFRKQIAGVRAQAPAKKPKVFLYDSGQDQPFTSGRYAAPEQIITEAGGVNVMHDVEDSWTTVGWESVVQRNPDAIVICDYGDVSAEQKKKFLLSYAPLRDVSAIRHKRIFVLDYVDLVESPRNPSAVARLGAYLRTVAKG
ncbi:MULTISPECIES: ABC transporter substrate-binding protein [Streptomyces]|uniref:ABC transporter substrate-binding protein n=1 Tax=Streptomyces caniscabiei TaxID=2746961 RepID=A0ABU4N3G0_9ACTN|nr:MULTISPECIES: ABC transporter substrate-binding protein [Streptomyces]MBE4733981.1 ABC transporter substrate-binding protein [Streptomyces caniscabiei]MBE4761396.1 ABC transporter substrate-binding protein [Streptomyces caniscabiei]MBE4775123.1 ABC transporter substrate-binding protein [Streptomyces caniscabiei]MBE4782476.1 ABC transporter substrate-binding protein [Streptomyces caniscabiei]MBE4791779.1 ABC transporter substrate-binding protein [Streptomyces caniscabiei]